MRARTLVMTVVVVATAACGAPVALGPASSSESPSQAPRLVPPAPAVSPWTPLRPVDVDRMLQRVWTAAGVAPAAPGDDVQFLRRVTLDLVGRVPTLDEAEAFLEAAAPAAQRRADLVDRLLASAEHAEAWADVYVNLFVGRQFRKPGVQQRLDPRAYFVQSFRDNRPYDRVATELLTFTGELQPGDPGAFIASQLAAGGPEAAASATARLFLGVQLQCAQCHDHPTDRRYRMEDFHGLAAYFARTRSRARRGPPPAAAAAPPIDLEGTESMVETPMRAGASQAEPDEEASPRPSRAPRTYTVIERARGPATAAFRRPDEREPRMVGPSFLGRAVAAPADQSLRQTLARTVVQSELFAKMAVERTWVQLFGAGLVEPWDDLGGEHDPAHPPLLTALAADFRAGGHDLRRLIRTLVSTDAYALSSRVPATSDATAAQSAPPPLARFTRGSVRRLTPEQLFRSLLTATGLQQMERSGGTSFDQKLGRLLREHLFVFGDDEGAEVVTFDGNIPQALLLWNGELANQGARAQRGGVLARILSESADAEVRLRRLFLATLTRPPTPAEWARLLPVVSALGAGRRGYEDVFFALLTSTEMTTNH